MHEPSSSPTAIYFRRLREGLRWLEPTEREDIVREIEGYVDEGRRSGRSVADILADLGHADRLARAYAATTLLRDDRRRWIASLQAAVLVAGTSAASLVVIPMLAVIAAGLAFCGALSLGLGIATFVVPELTARLNPPSPDGQILLFALGIICAGLGRLSLLLLRTYVGYAARFVRTGLQVGASATTSARA